MNQPALPVFERRRDDYLISSDPALLDLERIADLLSRAYWAQGRPRDLIARTLQTSLCFGLYRAGRQVGLARVITDYATFAYLCDVVVHEDERGQGLGRWLLASVFAHPALAGLRRWLLATRDAHALYACFGFAPLAEPALWMERYQPASAELPDDEKGATR